MHAVIFIGGGSLTREQSCVGDAILSRGLTRGEYIGGKLLARTTAILAMVGGVLLPASFWAIRQDQLTRTEDGYVATESWDTKVEAWDPAKIYANAEGSILETSVEQGDLVHVGDLMAQLDDRRLFDELESQRHSEECARRDLENARRGHEEAQRAVAAAEDAVGRAGRAALAGDFVSKVEQANLEADVRAREREVEDARSRVPKEAAAIATAQGALDEAMARVRAAREALGHAMVTSPLSGYVIEVLAQSGQWVGKGTHLYTVAPLDEYQIDVPIYDFDDFQKLKTGLAAIVRVQDTEFRGSVERLGATTTEDHWGRNVSFAVIRFSGDGTLGLLGLGADVRIVLPPEEEGVLADAVLNAITQHGEDDIATRTASVTPEWMLIGLAKVLGCACLLVALSILASVIFRSALVAILGVTGLWHISNLIFDFGGLPALSYLEMVRTMDKVLAGVADRGDEMSALAWLYGIAVFFGLSTVAVFVRRDPPG